LGTGPQVSGVSSEKARASLKPMLREGFTTPDNVQKKDLFINHVTRSEVKQTKRYSEKNRRRTFMVLKFI